MNHRADALLRRLLARAAAQAEDGSVAALSALERVCYIVAEETPALLMVATEYLWRKHRYRNPLEARDFIVRRVLSHYAVECSILEAATA